MFPSPISEPTLTRKFSDTEIFSIAGKTGLCLCFQKTEAEVFFFGLKCRNEESEHEVRAFAFSAKASEVSGKRRGGEEKNRFSKRFSPLALFQNFVLRTTSVSPLDRDKGSGP